MVEAVSSPGIFPLGIPPAKDLRLQEKNNQQSRDSQTCWLIQVRFFLTEESPPTGSSGAGIRLGHVSSQLALSSVKIEIVPGFQLLEINNHYR